MKKIELTKRSKLKFAKKEGLLTRNKRDPIQADSET